MESDKPAPESTEGQNSLGRKIRTVAVTLLTVGLIVLIVQFLAAVAQVILVVIFPGLQDFSEDSRRNINAIPVGLVIGFAIGVIDDFQKSPFTFIRSPIFLLALATTFLWPMIPVMMNMGQTNTAVGESVREHLSTASPYLKIAFLLVGYWICGLVRHRYFSSQV